MTTIEQDLAAAVEALSSEVVNAPAGEYLHRLANGQRVAFACCDFLRDRGAAIAEALLDAERWRALTAHRRLRAPNGAVVVRIDGTYSTADARRAADCAIASAQTTGAVVAMRAASKASGGGA